MRALLPLLGLAACLQAEPVINPLNIPADGKAGFTRVEPFTFTNRLSDSTVQRNRIYELGSGVALGDFDNDGWCDVYLANLEGDNALFRNLGSWRFEEVKSAALACAGEYSTGAVFADVDSDGDLDLLVSGIGHGVRLFINDGKGDFKERMDSGLARRFGATSMTLADIDWDGDLDLYVCNYRTTTVKDNPNEVRPDARQVGEKIVVTPADRFEALFAKGGGVMLIEKGEPDILYRNDGRGHFTQVPWTEGAFLDESGKPLQEPPRDWGLTAMFRDINGDGLVDLYVCNDFFQSPDRIWLAQEPGTFKAIAPYAVRTISMSSMSVDFADINRDGHDDFFVADMLSPHNEARQRQRANVLKGDLQLPFHDPYYRPEAARNTLFLARGDGTFAEIAQLAGIEATGWTWSSVFMDVDLDGFDDLILTAGNNHDVLDADSLRAMQDRGPAGAAARAKGIRNFPRLELPNVGLRNNGALTFTNKSADWGLDEPAISHGMAAADLDNDGDLDLVANRLNTSAAIYRNNSPAPRMLVRVKGGGTGAGISVNGASQNIIAGGRYLSGDAQERMFAARVKNEVRATFPDGKIVTVTNVPANSLCVIDPKDAKTPEATSEPRPRPFFVEIKAEDARTTMNPPAPPIKQLGLTLGVIGPITLLPSRDGLKLATGAVATDIDNDGDEDIAVAREWEPPLLYINDRGAWKETRLLQTNGWWTTVAAGDFDSDGKTDLVFGNWGRNTKYQNKRPVKAFYGEGGVVEAWTEHGRLVPVRDFDAIAAVLPDVRERFPTYRAFGEATIEQILGEHLAKMKTVTAELFDSMLFLNRDGKFEARPLPPEAQFTPVLSIATGDFDRDGKADLFLGQNILEGDQESSRHDAGAGLVLLGKGDGDFHALSPLKAGVWLWGETRSAAFTNGVLAVREKNGPPRFYKSR